MQVALNEHSSENVVFHPDGAATSEDCKMIEKAFRKHYLFYKLKDSQKQELILSMKCYRAETQQVIFERGDLASLFFVVKSGKVSVDVSGQEYIR